MTSIAYRQSGPVAHCMTEADGRTDG